MLSSGYGVSLLTAQVGVIVALLNALVGTVGMWRPASASYLTCDAAATGTCLVNLQPDTGCCSSTRTGTECCMLWCSGAVVVADKAVQQCTDNGFADFDFDLT